jgi:hypothetical protein
MATKPEGWEEGEGGETWLKSPSKLGLWAKRELENNRRIQNAIQDPAPANAEKSPFQTE